MTADSAAPIPANEGGERQSKRRRIGYACDLCRVKKVSLLVLILPCL